MKRVSLFVLICLVALLVSGSEDTIRRKSGLDIHIFDVGQAMSQLWVYPSGYTVFVDGPETNWKSGDRAKTLAPKLEKLLNGTKVIDVGVISHLHLDHLGYVGYGGYWSLIENFGFTFKKIIDRDSGYWVDSNGDGECDGTEIKYNNVGTISTTGIQWLCYATNPSGPVYKVRQNAKLCSTSQISPPDKDATVTIVSADAKGAKMLDGTPVEGDHHHTSFPPSENDYSIGLVARYGSFTFSTFGDLDGEYAKSEHGYVYDDIESTVIKRIGETDVYNVNHHGSSHSSSMPFLKALMPTVSVISCGENNSYGHPAQDTIDRLNKVCDHIFITEKGNPDVSYGNAIITNDDILIHVPSGEDTYTVTFGNSVHTYHSKGANQPKCTV